MNTRTHTTQQQTNENKETHTHIIARIHTSIHSGTHKDIHAKNDTWRTSF